MFGSCQQLFPVETWGTSLYRCSSWGLKSPLLHVSGDFPFCPLCTLPSLGVSGAVAMFSPWGGLWPLVLGTLCLEPCLICSCQTLWVTLPPWCPRALAPGPGWWGAGPSCWAGLYIMLIVKTQRHIFIIVIKLYCTKTLGQYLWEEQAGV